MKIGPVDIRNHTFKRKMNGVDEEEVQAFLDLVADRLEEEILASEELRTRIDRLQASLEEYESLEKSLRNSLISADQLADERLGAADREARIIVKNAEVDAEKIVIGARGELGRLRAELDDLRRQKLTYVERFRALLRSQSKILEASLQTFDPDREDLDAELAEPKERKGGRKGRQRPKGTEEALAPYLGEEGLFANMDAAEARSPARKGD